MLQGFLPPQSRRATYVESYEITDADSPYAPISLAGVTSGSAKLCRVGSETALVEKTWGAGLSSPSAGILQWQFDPADLDALEPTPHRLLVTIVASGTTVEIIDAVLPLT